MNRQFMLGLVGLLLGLNNSDVTEMGLKSPYPVLRHGEVNQFCNCRSKIRCTSPI